MSKAPFLECVSEDPVIKALARQVVRLLNDPSLDRHQREARVHATRVCSRAAGGVGNGSATGKSGNPSAAAGRERWAP